MNCFIILSLISGSVIHQNKRIMDITKLLTFFGILYLLISCILFEQLIDDFQDFFFVDLENVSKVHLNIVLKKYRHVEITKNALTSA